jgi:hypothetical protein
MLFSSLSSAFCLTRRLMMEAGSLATSFVAMRKEALLRVILVFVLFAVAQGVAYDAGFCAKVVAFDLSDGVNTTALDLQAQALYKQIPR